MTNVDNQHSATGILSDGFRAKEAAGSYVITSAPTFREKATLFPSACFIVGADTILRIDNVGITRAPMIEKPLLGTSQAKTVVSQYSGE